MFAGKKDHGLQKEQNSISPNYSGHGQYFERRNTTINGCISPQSRFSLDLKSDRALDSQRTSKYSTSPARHPIACSCLTHASAAKLLINGGRHILRLGSDLMKQQVFKSVNLTTPARD